MYLLIQPVKSTMLYTNLDLHPTMYLLIRTCNNADIAFLFNLHPTMYLLIPTKTKLIFTAIRFTSHYVSINSRPSYCLKVQRQYLHPTMYLLIHERRFMFPLILPLFTSHYVSINSNSFFVFCKGKRIYIPLCIY